MSIIGARPRAEKSCVFTSPLGVVILTCQWGRHRGGGPKVPKARCFFWHLEVAWVMGLPPVIISSWDFPWNEPSIFWRAHTQTSVKSIYRLEEKGRLRERERERGSYIDSWIDTHTHKYTNLYHGNWSGTLKMCHFNRGKTSQMSH